MKTTSERERRGRGRKKLYEIKYLRVAVSACNRRSDARVRKPRRFNRVWSRVPYHTRVLANGNFLRTLRCFRCYSLRAFNVFETGSVYITMFRVKTSLTRRRNEAEVNCGALKGDDNFILSVPVGGFRVRVLSSTVEMSFYYRSVFFRYLIWFFFFIFVISWFATFGRRYMNSLINRTVTLMFSVAFIIFDFSILKKKKSYFSINWYFQKLIFLIFFF